MATAKGTPEVAKAIVTIIPSMEGSRTKISDMIVPSADKAGKEAGSSIGGKISEGLSTAKLAIGNALGNIITSAVSNVSGTIKDTLKDAFEGFGDRQQLWGGVETLFKDSADTVAANAKKAFKTAGVSANQYMETVTGFSASLIQSLGGDTEKAARIADMALTDMSDNANKMGTDFSSLEWAYQGFAKQNYTMLDNLKLGYGGTKSEMQRLLKDATELTKAQGNYRKFSLDSYADIIEAIHLVQDNIGITGTTTEEAATTIQGSMGMAKAAWQDWLTGLASPDADMGELTRNLVGSLKTALDNVIPTVKEMAAGIGEGLVDVLSEAGFTGAADFAKNVIDGINSAKEGIGYVIGRVFENERLRDAAGRVAGLFGEIGGKVADFFSKFTNQPVSLDDIADTIANLASGGLELLGNALQWVSDHIEPVLSLLGEFAGAIANTAGALFDMYSNSEEAQELFGQLAQTIQDVLGGALDTVIVIAQWLIDKWNAVVDFFQNDPLGQEIVDIFSGIMGVIGDALAVISSLFKTVFGFIKGIVTGDFSEMFEGAQEMFGNLENLTQSGGDLLGKIIQFAMDAIGRIVETVLNGILEFGVNAINGMLDFIEKIPGAIIDFFTHLPENLSNLFQSAIDWIMNDFDDFLVDVASIPGQIVDFFASIPDKIASIFSGIKLPQLHMVGDFNLDPTNFKLPRIELFARGGIVTKPTNAIIGEAGYPEAVIPLTSRYLTPLLESADVRRGGDTYNVINGLEIAPDDYIQEVMVEFFQFLQRKAAMQRG